MAGHLCFTPAFRMANSKQFPMYTFDSDFNLHQTTHYAQLASKAQLAVLLKHIDKVFGHPSHVWPKGFERF